MSGWIPNPNYVGRQSSVSFGAGTIGRHSGGIPASVTMTQQSRNSTPTRFDFEVLEPGVFVRARPHYGNYIVHDTRCSYSRSKTAKPVPIDDIGEYWAEDGRAQVCCTQCRRMGWLWEWDGEEYKPEQRKPPSPGVRGVYWEPSRQKWRVIRYHAGKRYNIGRFDTTKEATAAAAQWEKEVGLCVD